MQIVSGPQKHCKYRDIGHIEAESGDTLYKRSPFGSLTASPMGPYKRTVVIHRASVAPLQPMINLKSALAFGAAVLSFSSISSAAIAQTYVGGYYRSNGTYVRPHYRSSANHTQRDNYSTRGNTNPYTGARGTKSCGLWEAC